MSFLINPFFYTQSPYFIVGIEGDSIMRGTSSGGAVGPTALPGTVYEFNGTDLVELTTADLSTAASGSPWKQFAIDHNANTGKIVVLVSGAVGGAELGCVNGDTNNWTSTGANRSSFQTKLNNCLSLLGRTTPDVIFLGTAVNDARSAVALSTIQTGLQDLITWNNSNWPNTPILMPQMGRTESNFNNTNRISSVRSYIKDLAKNNSNVHICGSLPSFVGNGYYVNSPADLLHLNQSGNNELGKMFARWFQNSAYSKWARSIISSFFTNISSTRKALIDTFIQAEIANGNYFKFDVLNSFKNEDVKNIHVDWAFLFGPEGIGSPAFTANSHLATNGTNSQYWKTGYTPSVNVVNISLNDAAYGIKIRTRTTTGLSVAMGVSDGTQRVMIGQNATPAVAYYMHDNAIKASTIPDTVLQADTLYSIFRTDVSLNEMFKNITSIHNVGNLSVGLPGFEMIIGANNASNTIGNAMNATYEYYYAAKSDIALASFYSNMETLIDNW